MTNGTPAAAAARAAPRSACRWAISRTPIGASRNGVGCRRPNSSTDVSREETSFRNRGTIRQHSNADRFAAIVDSSPAPPAMYANPLAAHRLLGPSLELDRVRRHARPPSPEARQIDLRLAVPAVLAPLVDPGCHPPIIRRWSPARQSADSRTAWDDPRTYRRSCERGDPPSKRLPLVPARPRYLSPARPGGGRHPRLPLRRLRTRPRTGARDALRGPRAHRRDRLAGAQSAPLRRARVPERRPHAARIGGPARRRLHRPALPRHGRRARVDPPPTPWRVSGRTEHADLLDCRGPRRLRPLPGGAPAPGRSRFRRHRRAGWARRRGRLPRRSARCPRPRTKLAGATGFRRRSVLSE